EELGKAEARVKAGTPAREVYAAIISQGLTRAPAPPPSAAAAPAAPQAGRVPVRPDDPVRGPKVAKVTVTLFSAFPCPFCPRPRRVHPARHQLPQPSPKDAPIVWTHPPLPMHPSAMPAAEAAEAAREQRKFWEMHDRMFAAQQQLSPAQFETWARELHLDLG